MKYFFNFAPTFIFFIIYQMYNIFLAIKLLILFSGFMLIIDFYIFKKIDKICLFNFVNIFIFGSCSILLHNSNYIKWKITIIYFLMFLYLFFYQKWKKKLFFENILRKKLVLPHEVWINLDFIWAIFFLFCSIINLYVALFFPENIWVNFKVFGLTTLTLIFIVITVIYIRCFISKKK
ncbi:inner membrane-spanning protein YciB [Buchnera aphidicola]|uniref:inner membrane-spanning protein YciB n=1 Tax=Buchnera aphidicola TaxID=9 RepID=UPI003463857F